MTIADKFNLKTSEGRGIGDIRATLHGLSSGRD